MKKNTCIICFMVVGIILILFFMFCIVNGKIEAQQEAKQKAIEYLYNKYNKNFNLDFSSGSFKNKEYFFDGTFECGHDWNIKEYVFKVSLDNIPVISYITVWKNLTTNVFEIEEVNGAKNNSTDTSYEIETNRYNKHIENSLQKNVVKNDLEKLLHDKYSDYKIDYDYDYYNNVSYYSYDYNRDSSIKVSFKHSLISELENELKNINSLIQLLKSKGVSIGIEAQFTDFTRRYSANTKIDEEKKVCLGVKQIKQYLDENYKFKYSMRLYPYKNQLHIEFPIRIRQNPFIRNKSQYIEFLMHLNNISISNNMDVEISFIDDCQLLSQYTNFELLEKEMIWNFR